jgi:hypothetical protein
VLLLRHPLAALLYDGAHWITLTRRCMASSGMLAQARCRPAGHTPTFRLPPLQSPSIPRCPPLPHAHGQRTRRALSWPRRTSPAGTG